MSKTKIAPKEPVITLEEAQRAMTAKAEFESKIETINAQVKIEKAQLDSKYADALQVSADGLTQSEETLKKFADQHRSEWGVQKSFNIGIGKIGFRKSTAWNLIAKSWDEVAQTIRTMYPKSNIVTEKKSLTLDKTKLKLMDTYWLQEVGCELVENETFYAEIK